MVNTLIVLGGLPGTGKTSVARPLSARLGAVYLRIDVIEQALRQAGLPVGPTGYAIAQDLAAANLALGLSVVADCVNPVEESREAWRALATAPGVALLEIEVICSDAAEHRRRVEGRVSDIAGLVPPDWASVQRRAYAPWQRKRFVLDTARLEPAEAVVRIEAEIARCARPELG